MSEDYIRLEQSDNMPIVSVIGEADFSKSDLLDRAIAVHEAEKSVIVSFLECTSVDGAILTVLVRWNVRLEGNLVIIVPRFSAIRRFFEATPLYESLRLVGNVTDAVTLATGLKRMAESEPSTDGQSSGFRA